MLIRKSLKIFVAVLLLTAAAGVHAGDRATIAPRKDYAQAAAALERFIAHELKDKQLPAISVALVDGNEVVWARGFGYADPKNQVPATATTVYRIGSVSKLFTDIGIMQMVERGKLDLDVPVATYLPDFKPANQFTKPVTLRQLMAHRSGLLREPPVGHYFDDTQPSIAATVRSMSGHPLIYEPEMRVKYSNAGITVAGYVLEATNQQPFAAYMKRAVLQPMGLESSAFEREADIRKRLAKAFIWTYDGRVFAAPTFEPGIAPAGSMYSNVTDLGRFITVLLNEGRGPAGAVLKPETLKSMWEPQFQQREPRNFGIGFILGKLDGHRMVGHSGAVYGFATELEAMPDDHIGAVAVTTMDSANGVTIHIVQEALRLMLAAKAGKPLPEIPVTEAIAPELAHKLAGRYGEGEKAVDLFERDHGLYFTRVGGGSQVRLRKLGNDLVVDDRLGFGARVIPIADGIQLNGEVLRRVPSPGSAAMPEELKGLIGEYGWDYNVLYITEREGHLESLIEWYEYEPLTQVSKDVFLYPPRGLYDNEQLVFTRDASGRATQVTVGGVVFKRRSAPVRWDP